MSEMKKPHLLDGVKTTPYQPGGSGGSGDEVASIAISPGGGNNCKNRTSDAESRLNAALDEVQIRFVMNLPSPVSIYRVYLCRSGGGGGCYRRVVLPDLFWLF